MSRIDEIEFHYIFPAFQDFNATHLARSHGPVIQGRTILVLKTNDGLEGLGEYWGFGLDEDDLRSRYIGTDPFDWLNAPTELWMNMATYDLMGKKLGVPAWKLIGLKVRSWVPVAAWTVSRQPAEMAAEVRQAARRGYRWIKYHLDQSQNVLDQTEAMQAVAPPGFKVHYDLNADLEFYTICPIVKELERFPVAGRIEDPMVPADEDGYRLLREKCKLPMITHHGPAEFMARKICDGFMGGHAAVGAAAKLAAVAEMTRTPLMLQNCGGTINQAFQAHQVAVFKMATIDHVNVCHLWKEDVTVEQMPVVGGCVQVPEGPGLGVTLDRARLEKCAAQKAPCARALPGAHVPRRRPEGVPALRPGADGRRRPEKSRRAARFQGAFAPAFVRRSGSHRLLGRERRSGVVCPLVVRNRGGVSLGAEAVRLAGRRIPQGQSQKGSPAASSARSTSGTSSMPRPGPAGTASMPSVRSKPSRPPISAM